LEGLSKRNQPINTSTFRPMLQEQHKLLTLEPKIQIQPDAFLRPSFSSMCTQHESSLYVKNYYQPQQPNNSTQNFFISNQNILDNFNMNNSFTSNSSNSSKPIPFLVLPDRYNSDANQYNSKNFFFIQNFRGFVDR
jgi:hypothetical protein